MPFPQAGGVDTQTSTGVKEFVFGKMATQQTTNISANDHVKFDTLITSRGTSVALDTSTAYVTTAGAASVGRITLKANKTYKLVAAIPYALGSGATGLLDACWYDATNSANLPGSFQSMLVASTATHDIGGGVAMAVFTPTSDVLVELRIITATALTQIGHTTNRHPEFFVETL